MIKLLKDVAEFIVAFILSVFLIIVMGFMLAISAAESLIGGVDNNDFL